MAWPKVPKVPQVPAHIQARLQEPLLKVLSIIAKASPRERMVSGFLGFIAYVLFQQSVRYHRRRAIHKEFPYTTRESMAKMTDHDAWAIQKTMMQTEYPFIVIKSLQFALFRVSITFTSHHSLFY